MKLKKSKSNYFLSWKFGVHKMHNRFPGILYYLIPRRLTLDEDKPIYKWMWWWFAPKQKKH